MAVLVASLSDLAVSVTCPVAALPAVRVTYTGTFVDWPNFAIASAFTSSAVQPAPLEATESR